MRYPQNLLAGLLVLMFIASPARGDQVNLLQAQQWSNLESTRRNNEPQLVKLETDGDEGWVFQYPYPRKSVSWGTMLHKNALALAGGNLFIDFRFTDMPSDAGYFGLRLRGVTLADGDDDVHGLEVRILPAQSKVICGGSEWSYRPRPEDPLRMEMVLHLDADQIRMVYGRETLLKLPIRYIRPSTQELMLVLNEARVQVEQLTAEVANEVQLDFDFESVSLRHHPVPIASPFIDYFGTHYSGSDGAGARFSAVRSFGGTHVGLIPPPAEAAVSKRIGPFDGDAVRVRLDDFHSQSKFARNPVAGVDLLQQLVDNNVLAIFPCPTGEAMADVPFDRDFAYWFYRLAHEAVPDLKNHAVWQIGNEIVSNHWNPKRLQRSEYKRFWSSDRTLWSGYNLDWKLDFYINGWLGPEIEAIQAAARDVYNDSHAIPIATGSLNPYNNANVWFVEELMSARFDPERVPTLKGDRVVDHIDFLTVHYMLGPPGHPNRERLDTYVNKYIRTGDVKGIWITEEHGARARGATTVLARAIHFLNWVADNQLSAEQAKVFWYGEKTREGLGNGADLMTKLGTFFESCDISFSRIERQNASFYVLSGSPAADPHPDRILVVVLPNKNEQVNLGTLDLSLSSAAGEWEVEAIDYSPVTAPTIFNVECRNTRDDIQLTCERVLINPTAIYITRKQEQPR